VAKLFDPTRIHDKPEALRGIRVLDLSVIYFSPATADFLGELGAEVLKVEMPGQGDVTRILGNASFFWKNVSVAFFCANHSKYHVGVDMHKPEGQELIRQLAARSDIVRPAITTATSSKNTSATAPAGWPSSTAGALSDRARDFVGAKKALDRMAVAV